MSQVVISHHDRLFWVSSVGVSKGGLALIPRLTRFRNDLTFKVEGRDAEAGSIEVPYFQAIDSPWRRSEFHRFSTHVHRHYDYVPPHSHGYPKSYISLNDRLCQVSGRNKCLRELELNNKQQLNSK
jgi:hypothetical protein